MENEDRLEGTSQRHSNPDDQTSYGSNSCHYQSPLQRLLDYTMEFRQGTAGQNQDGNSHFQITPYQPNGGPLSSSACDSMQNFAFMGPHKSPQPSSIGASIQALDAMYQTNFESCHRVEELSSGGAYHWSYPPNASAFNLHQQPQSLSNPSAEILWNAFHEAGGHPTGVSTSYPSYPHHSQHYNSGLNHPHSQMMQCQNRRFRRQQNCPYAQTFGIIPQQLVRQPGQVEIEQTIRQQSSSASNASSRGES
ncbi:hypothetical protein Aperf_G00000050095 [Anoplocephala perfoliata]